MSYISQLESETGGPPFQAKIAGGLTIRKLTASQGARSELYEVREATGKNFRWQMVKRLGTLPKAIPQPAKSNIAEREHIGRLLRDCQSKSEALLNSSDPIESTLLGSGLTAILQELWSYREAREDDWVEILNVLQIVLTGQEFETLSKEKRLALVRIFQEGLLARTVGRTEVERTLHLLSDVGFDIWRGIQEQENVTEGLEKLALGDKKVLEKIISLPSQWRAVVVDVLSEAGESGGKDMPFHEAVEHHKREIIRRALVRAGGSKTKAAELLGLKFTLLERLIKQMGIESRQ